MIGDLLKHIGDFFVELFRKEEWWFIMLFIGAAATIPFFTVNDFEAILIGFLRLTWGLWLFIALFPLVRETFLHLQQERYKRKIKWTLLELRLPREVLKSPKGMEQVLVTLQTLRNSAGNLKEKYIEGQVTQWFSLEIVSFSGEVHFYIRVPERQKNVVEAAFFSYYSDVEIVEVEDYVSKLPTDFHDAKSKNMDVWGMEIGLAKGEAYPIKTYSKFEDPEENRQIDPIGNLLEVFGKGKSQEIIMLQILIAPAGSDWKDVAKEEIEKLRSPQFADTGDDKKTVIARSPGQTAVLEAVEENISKSAFLTLMRVGYIAPKEIFSDGYVRSGIMGALNQYGTVSLNAFKGNSASVPKTKSKIRKQAKTDARKQVFLWNLRNRWVPPESWIGSLLSSYAVAPNFASKRFLMNVEAIATVFHPPTSFVLTAPHVSRVESRKAGTPAGLAIFGGDSEIERFTK